ncbi:MAG: SDR family NAD(P)-dependent oxidoreductase, partial [Pseudomonadota bacterium]
MTLPQTPSFRLDGKRALVAGASSGIGFGCAVALAEAGAVVTLSARNEARLEAAVSEMTAAGLQARSIHMDVVDIGATEAT